MKPRLGSGDLSAAVAAMQNVLRGSPTGGAVGRIRREVQPSFFDQAVTLVRGNPAWARREFHAEFPRQVGEMAHSYAFEPVSLKRELQWARAYLRPHRDAIGTFVKGAEQFYSSLAAGRIRTAGKALEDIEIASGQSLWLLKNKLFLAQTAGGLESQKRLAANLQAAAHRDPITNVILHYVSERNEPSVTAAGFVARIKETLDTADLPRPLQAYLRYHLMPVPGATSEDTASILSIESHAPVLDYYVALVHVLPTAADGDEARGAAIRVIESLAEASHSRRLQFLYEWLVSPTTREDRVDRRADEATSLFLQGKYGAAAQAAEHLLLRDPLNSDAIDIIARCRVLSGASAEFENKTGSARLIGQLQSLYGGDDRSEAATDQLEKALFNWAGTPFTAHIASALAKFARPSLVAGMSLSASRVVYAHPIFTPEKIADVALENDRNVYASRISDATAQPIVGAYAAALAGGPIVASLSQLDSDRHLVMTASIARNSGNLPTYESAARQLTTSKHKYYRNIGLRWAADALLREQKLDELLRLIVTAVVDDASLRPFLPLGDLVQSIDRDERRSLRSEIALPILYDIYSRNESSRYDDLRATVCESFLRSHGTERPSKLKDDGSFLANQLTYFLRFVCTEDILDSSQAFNSSREVAEERLAICRMLTERDPDNKQTYESEIRDILRRLVVKRRMREIEESKVNVDEARIRANLSESVREAVNRYLAHRNSGLTIAEYKQLEAAVEDMKALGTQDRLTIILPRNEAYEILLTAVQGVRDEYVSSTEYGLDGILSMNVRHGTLVAQLRNPLESGNLVTRRDPKTKAYQRHIGWVDPHESDVGAVVEERLSAFTVRIDALIERIVGTWIQVKKQTGEPGLFDFEIHGDDIEALDRELTAVNDFDTFVTVIFQRLKAKLATSLEDVRTHLAAEAKPEALRLLSRLEVEIGTLDFPAAGRLVSAVHIARTELQSAFDRVASWFKVAQATATEPFAIDDAIHLSAASVRLQEPRFDVQIRIDQPNAYYFDGSRLASVFYILYNAFANVGRHSYCQPAIGQIVVEARDGLLHISISNEISPDMVEETTRRIEAANATLGERRDGQRIGGEGGSGLHKIRAILARDFQTESSLALSMVPGGTATLSFCLSVKED